MRLRAPTGRERQHAVDALHAAVRDGRLDLAGFDAHLAALLSAPTLADVERLAGQVGVAPFRMELRGTDGIAVLEPDRVVLTFGERWTADIKEARSPRVVPLPAIAAVELESGWASGHIRLRLVGEAPSYQPRKPSEDVNAVTFGVADQGERAKELADEVRRRIALEPRVPEPQLLPPQHRLPGLPPPPPGELFVRVRTVRHVVTLDENGVLIEHRSGGAPRRWIPLTAIAAVEFHPGRGFRSGHVRFVLAGLPAGYRRPAPGKDPDAFTFGAVGREAGEAEELAAHVAARITRPRVVEPRLLPGNQPADWGPPRDHPPAPPAWNPPAVATPVPAPPVAPPPVSGPPSPSAVPVPSATPAGDAPAQLRELAKLRAEGLITDADYEAKKQEILRRW
ncbi:DUF4429 domain-containing protein [Phytohabitans sp. LJ34]|uniref:DUF4429 domain-containing protein n=1 Tax=Phytohabitans sp. LJ34 TaxID=3452217 RepID=UPI003F8A3302